MIDDLSDRVRLNNGCVCYFYIDYKDENSQATDNIVRNLFKQMLSHVNLIPPKLEELYDESLKRCRVPDVSIFTQQFISASSTFTSIFVLLDALDECVKENFLPLIRLVNQLREAGIKILCTSRIDTPLVQTQLGQPKVVEIKAEKTDIENYLSIRLKQDWIYGDESKQKILNSLADAAMGKFFPFRCVSDLGSYSLSFSSIIF